MRIEAGAFPLVVLVNPETGWDPSAIGSLDKACEALWRRRERYAFLSYSAPHAKATSARGRRLVAEWANGPRVREMTRTFCVGAASVVPHALARGALTALLWLWVPPTPHRSFGTAHEAIDHCIDRLLLSRVDLPGGAAPVRKAAFSILDRAATERSASV